MQRQEQQQVQRQQLTQQLVRRLPILEADRRALLFRLERLRRFNPHLQLEGNAIEWMSAAVTGFEERLFTQIMESGASPSLQALMRRLVLTLDHRGFLPETDVQLAARFDVTPGEVEQARRALLFLEPTGIGSRDETECQYRHAIEHDHPLVLDVFEGLQQKIPNLASRLGLSKTAFDEVKRLVLTLPKVPILYEETSPILPEVDVAVEGESLVTTWFSPELNRAMVEADPEAAWWFESLSMRNETLRRVWGVIATRQDAWLRGELELHPLTRREVAEAIGNHESTVGRAIQGKYVRTVHGMMEWSELFVRPTEAGQSPFQMKRLLSAWIQAETTPLSDQQLADALARHGYQVTRRTVANYREALGFKNSRERERALGGE